MPDLTVDEQLAAAQAAWTAAATAYDETCAAALVAKIAAADAYRAAFEAVEAQKRLAVDGETAPEQRIMLADTFGAADTAPETSQTGERPPNGPPLWGPATS